MLPIPRRTPRTTKAGPRQTSRRRTSSVEVTRKFRTSWCQVGKALPADKILELISSFPLLSLAGPSAIQDVCRNTRKRTYGRSAQVFGHPGQS